MKKEKIFRRLFIGVIILIALFFIFKIYFISKNNIQQTTVSIFAQSNKSILLEVFNRANSWFKDFFHFNQIRNQVQNLKEENNNLLWQLTQFKNLEEENISLKLAFNVKQETGWNLLPARIVLVDPTGLNGNFWIDKGQNSGLKPGMNVILENQVLVGVLKECLTNYCRGKSIFAPQTKIGVKDIESRVLAILEKDNQFRFILKLVPRDTQLQLDDLLVTSNENTGFLPGLLVAKVKNLISSESSLQEYLTEPLFLPNQLFSVFVITDSIF
ncbi:MAG: rod shape-determining protein MreC [Candidatus Paceibacterota bacterium]|jgi:cell shape-determining protein MreC